MASPTTRHPSPVQRKPYSTTGFAPDKVYDDPETADKALTRMKRNVKRNAGARPQIAVGDLVRVRVKLAKFHSRPHGFDFVNSKPRRC